MRIAGIVLLAVGLMLLFFGINSSQVIGERVVEGMTGRYTTNTMWYLIGGIGMLAAGGALVYYSGKRY